MTSVEEKVSIVEEYLEWKGERLVTGQRADLSDYEEHLMSQHSQARLVAIETVLEDAEPADVPRLVREIVEQGL